MSLVGNSGKRLIKVPSDVKKYFYDQVEEKTKNKQFHQNRTRTFFLMMVMQCSVGILRDFTGTHRNTDSQ